MHQRYVSCSVKYDTLMAVFSLIQRAVALMQQDCHLSTWNESSGDVNPARYKWQKKPTYLDYLHLLIIKFSHEVDFNFLSFLYVMFNSSLFMLKSFAFFLLLLFNGINPACILCFFLTLNPVQVAGEGDALCYSQSRQVQEKNHSRRDWKEDIVPQSTSVHEQSHVILLSCSLLSTCKGLLKQVSSEMQC